jgi:hypothetical protein
LAVKADWRGSAKKEGAGFPNVMVLAFVAVAEVAECLVVQTLCLLEKCATEKKTPTEIRDLKSA